MYIQKKNGVWWLRQNSPTDNTKTTNRNLGKDYKVARTIVIEELDKIQYGDWATPEYKQNFLEKMERIEKENPSFITLKMTRRQYEKIKSHLPPELRIY